ncbi:hypothetical protein ACFL5W_01695 [Thermodesulfobacteriota bacterium]
MPYYICRVNRETNINTIIDTFSDGAEAYAFEAEMEDGRQNDQSYMVTTIFAENESESKEKIRAFRIERGLPV